MAATLKAPEGAAVAKVRALEALSDEESIEWIVRRISRSCGIKPNCDWPHGLYGFRVQFFFRTPIAKLSDHPEVSIEM